MTSKKILKEKLFSQGASALNAMGLVGDHYICPLCTGLFGREHLSSTQSSPAKLTLKHVPPKSQGGREIILTCVSCNNRAGTMYEGAIKDREVHATTLSRLGASNANVGPVVIKAGSLSVNALLSKSDGVTEITYSKKHNHPKRLEDFAEFMRNSSDGCKIDLVFDIGYDAAKVRLADLKTAFLLCTANFGYSYALSENLSFIREQLITGVESTYTLRYIDAPSIPRNSIYADNDFQIAPVKFDHKALLLPLSDTTPDQFLQIAHSGRSGMRGGYQPFPRSFVVHLDHLGEKKIALFEESS